MSRPPRAGSAGKLVGLRVTDDERREWKRWARDAGQSLSDWLRSLANDEVDWLRSLAGNEADETTIQTAETEADKE